MHTYILRRILIAIPILLGLLTINFFLIHAAPGDPTDIFYNPDMSPEARDNIRRIYGLDQPVGVQFFKYIGGIFFNIERTALLRASADADGSLEEGTIPPSIRESLAERGYALPEGASLAREVDRTAIIHLDEVVPGGVQPGPVPEALRAAFEEAKRPLGPGAIVSSRHGSDRGPWRIFDDAARRGYVVKQQGDRLAVYREIADEYRIIGKQGRELFAVRREGDRWAVFDAWTLRDPSGWFRWRWKAPEFGYSFAKKRAVTDEILDALPNTIQLSALALLIELSLGIAVGIVAAVRQYSLFDSVSRVTALTFYSMPSFYLGLILLFLFAGGVSTTFWFPASGMIDVVRHESMTTLGRIGDRLIHIALPSITLGVGAAASISRYMRGELLEVIRQDYIRTARAKGLRERVVIFRHGVRNALIPIITIAGLSLPFLFSGAVVVENVFAWPGMGRVAVDAAFQRDYSMFLAVNIIFGAMVVLGSLVADVLYAVVDPRVRLS